MGERPRSFWMELILRRYRDGSRRLRRFPELGRFQSQRERCIAWSKAINPLLLLIFVGIMFITDWLTRAAPLLDHFPDWVPLAVFFVAMITVGIALNFWHNRLVTRSLRRQLAVRGELTCLKCGYDLTGNVSGRCPECGNATACSPGRPSDRPA